MTTNADFIRDALGLIGVLRVSQNPTANQGTQALRVMNDLFFEWAAIGIDLQYSSQDNLTDECPIDERESEPCKANLAVRLAPYYAREPSAILVAMASSGYDRLMRDAALAARKIAKTRNLPRDEGKRYGWRSANIITGD